MKKIKLLLITLIGAGICITTINASAQIKIGGTSKISNKNAYLELGDSTGNKGLLMPRVALSSTDSAAPLNAHVAGMHVYNTATAGSGTTAVRPGEYYSNGTQWIPLAAATAINTPVTSGTRSGPFNIVPNNIWNNTGSFISLPAAGVYLISSQTSFSWSSGCSDLFLRFSGLYISAQSLEWKRQLCGNPYNDWFNTIIVVTVTAPTTLHYQYLDADPATIVSLEVSGINAIKLF